jgi:hypothetical protein
MVADGIERLLSPSVSAEVALDAATLSTVMTSVASARRMSE